MADIITVGTLESSDCMVSLKPSKTLEIKIDTIVHEAFYHHIKTVVEKILNEAELKNIHLSLTDKGALDYTIKARLKTAIERFKEANNG